MLRLTNQAKEVFKLYPDEIQEMLSDLFTSTLNFLDLDNIVSILLIGSGSRGELSYTPGSELDIFSDVEFVIVVKKMISKEDIIELDKIYRNLEDLWKIRSPLFYIDYGISTELKFKYTPPTLWAYEAKTLGVVVYGEDVKQYLPDVDCNTLDFGNLNELVIVRLWNMLIHINNDFVDGMSSKYENFVIQFYYARNILDILTILLPNHGVLKGGYKNRSQYFINGFNSDRWNHFKSGISDATDFKLNMINNSTLREFQCLFLEGFVNLVFDISNINNANGFDDLIKSKEVIIQKNIFRERWLRFLRRKVVEFQLFSQYYKFNPSSLILFTSDKIRINLLYMLFYLHKFMQINLPENEKKLHLESAIRHFNVFAKVVFIYNDKHPTSKNFKELRSKLLDFMMIWFYSRSGKEKSVIMNYIQWRDK